MPESASFVDQFAHSRVLCIGDVILDQYVYGGAHRLSPEAPIPVFEHKSAVFSLGGAANVAANIAEIRAHCTLISLVGQDEAATTLKQHLNAHSHIETVLIPDASRPTPFKTRYITNSQQLLRVDQERVAPPATDLEDILLKAIEHALPTCTIVVLSDYGKGLLTPRLCAFVIAKARDANIPVIVDPKGHDYERYRGATLITPNRKELFEASGMPTHTDEQVVTACQSLMQRFSVQGMIATRSEQGMTAVWGDTVRHCPTRAIAVYDVTGAGDTVVAFLAMALGVDMDIEHAMDLANTAAGLVVQKRGTATVSPYEMRRAYRKNHPEMISALKITDRTDIPNFVKTWKDQGLSIGFTNGCFDVLHVGHVRLLAFARMQCDRLIVGINSDASVRRLKGPTRPIHDENNRQLLLAALESVDAVVLFDEDTPAALIADIQPDLLVKGGDYTVDTIVGAPDVLSRGGRVEVFPTIAGHSSTAVIARIQGQS